MTEDLLEFGLSYISGHVPNSDITDWYVFSVIRNEVSRLPYFLQYYREMGAKLFIIADNQSEDNTVQYLQAQPDVLLFNASGRYSESNYGVDWLNALLDKYGQNRWCLTVDADELLVFPHCERLDMRDVTHYLDKNDVNAFPVFLLDMYSKEPICEANYTSGEAFLSICHYFDATSYTSHQDFGLSNKIPSRGGPRHRLFWEGYIREKPSPYLVKVPLARWSSKLRYKASTHLLANAKISDISGALLHFKFFADFPLRAQEEANRQEHFNAASQYYAYSEAFTQNPKLCAFYEESVHYINSDQLVDLGLIYSSKIFEFTSRKDIQ